METRIIKFYVLISGFWLLTAFQTVAADTVTGTNLQNTTDCGARMDIRLKDEQGVFTTNQPVTLLISVTNVSDQILYAVETQPKSDYSFVIKLPSGNETNIVPKQANTEENRRIANRLAPSEGISWEFDFRSFFSPNESGVYKILATRQLLTAGGGRCSVVSNPLNFIISN